MLNEGINKQQQKIEELQDKIDKVINITLVIKWHIEYSSRPELGLLGYGHTTVDSRLAWEIILWILLFVHAQNKNMIYQYRALWTSVVSHDFDYPRALMLLTAVSISLITFVFN